MFTIFLFIFFIFCIISVILVGKIVIDSVKKGRWGVNFTSVNCPKCGKTVPTVRTPASTRQAMWGGWTCSECGCEMDKWGKEISSADEINISRQQIEQSKTNFIEPFDEEGKTPVERIFQEKE